MPDEKGNTKGDEDTIPQSSAHAYREGREEDVVGDIKDGDDTEVDDAVKTGGATSGGPPREAGSPNDDEGAKAENIETDGGTDS